MMWVGHVLDHVPDHMIIDLVTTALHRSIDVKNLLTCKETIKEKSKDEDNCLDSLTLIKNLLT